MMKMIKEWKTGCAAFLGNIVYNAADKKLKSVYRGILLALVMDFVLSLFIVVKMWPINSFGRLVWLLLLLFFAFVFSLCAADDIMEKLMTALVTKYRPYAQLYSRRKREKEIRKASQRAKRKEEKERAGRKKVQKERTGQKKVHKERAERENAQQKKVQKEKVEREKTQRERSEQEKTQRERAEREKAQKEKAEREKAQKERAEREKAQKEKAEREKAQREREERAKEEQRKQGQISSIQQARQLLRMKESFTKAELKKARNIMMKKYHPDNKDGGDEELCKKINAAYALLSKYAKAA